MSAPESTNEIARDEERPDVDDAPQKLSPMTWVTLGGFAVFVVLFGTCAHTFLFN